MSAVLTRDIVKVYSVGTKRILAVNKLNLEIKKGEIFGLLGPNGAGKTTTLRILSTVIAPTSGEAEVYGFDIKEEPLEVRKRIAYMPQGGALHPYLKVLDQFIFYFLTHGMDKKIAKELSLEALKQFNLEKDAFKIPTQLSGGLKRIVDVTRVLMSGKELVFLDEPTVGLDPVMKRKIWQFITEVNKKGTTVVITTHNIEEAEKLCSRVAFINSGKLVLCDASEEIKKKVGGTTVEIQFNGEELNHIKEAMEELRREPGVINVSWQGFALNIVVKKEEVDEMKFLTILKRHNLDVRSFQISKETLEDAYLMAVEGGAFK